MNIIVWFHLVQHLFLLWFLLSRFNILCLMILWSVPAKFPPGQFPPDRSPPDNSPSRKFPIPGQLLPGHFPHKKIPTRTFPSRTVPSWTVPSRRDLCRFFPSQLVPFSSPLANNYYINKLFLSMKNSYQGWEKTWHSNKKHFLKTIKSQFNHKSK